MHISKPIVFVLLFFCASIKLSAQQDSIPKWLSMPYSKKVSLQTAMIQVNNKTVTYNDILKIPDTSILKVEVYSKKAAQDIVGKDEAKNGLVLVTLHKKHFPYYSPQKDSSKIYIVEKGDTIYCKHAQPAMLGDTTNTEWVEFLQHSLKSQTPADNGAPAGLYIVEILFVVKEDGSVSQLQVLEDPGYGTAAEVKRLMAISPLWTPAMCDDIKVIYRQREKIAFFVSEQ